MTRFEVEIYEKQQKEQEKETYFQRQKVFNEAVRQKNMESMKKNLLIKANAEIRSSSYTGKEQKPSAQIDDSKDFNNSIEN